MASIARAKDGRWRAQVYVLGHRTSASFRTYREANAWAAQTEKRLRDGVSHRRDLERKIGAGRLPSTAEEIMADRVKVANHAGIYILFIGDQITYVGQSSNVIQRIASHVEKGRAFDSYHVIPCLPCDLDELERRYIEILSPPENKTPIMRRSVLRESRRSVRLESSPRHSVEAAPTSPSDPL